MRHNPIKKFQLEVIERMARDKLGPTNLVPLTWKTNENQSRKKPAGSQHPSISVK